jgi:RHS repeat-associated protein
MEILLGKYSKTSGQMPKLNWYSCSNVPQNLWHCAPNQVEYPHSPTDVLFNMKYDERDQLIEKNTALVSGKYLQSTDYEYNNRGWLTSINKGFQGVFNGNDLPLFGSNDGTASNNYPLLQTGLYTPSAQAGEDNADLFKEILKYGETNPSLANTPQYNGNISQVEWQVAGREAQVYTYSYDKLSRLTNANYTDIHSSPARWGGVQYSNDNKFGETISYDLRGNILSLQRNGRSGGGTFSPSNFAYGNFTPIDNLSYQYQTDSLNNLQKVVDNSNNLNFGFKSANQTNNYVYDKNGNLIADPNKRIIRIQYNYLNLPQVIEFSGVGEFQSGKVTFIYDANGVKLRKIHTPQYGTPTTFDYVNGVEYKNDVFQRLEHTEGAVVINPTTGAPEHEYHIKDHLGNIRVTYRDKDKNDGGYVGVADIKQINHYYPFGMNMEGNWNGVDGQNKYQYNGKEWQGSFKLETNDFGLGWNDYGARFYDPAVSRWWSIDPLADKYYSYSPYHYALLNPVKYVDLDGREVDVSNLLKDHEGFYTLVNTMLDLVSITGMSLAVNKGKLVESGETNESKGNKGARDYLRSLLGDKENNIVVKQGALPEWVMGNTDSDNKGFTVDAKQVDAINYSLEKGGVSKLAFGFGMVFLHEAMHTKSGVKYFPDNDFFNHFGEIGGLSRIEQKLNVFRQELGLPTLVSTTTGAWNSIWGERTTTWNISGTEKVIAAQKKDESVEDRSKRLMNFNNLYPTLWFKSQ